MFMSMWRIIKTRKKTSELVIPESAFGHVWEKKDRKFSKQFKVSAFLCDCIIKFLTKKDFQSLYMMTLMDIYANRRMRHFSTQTYARPLESSQVFSRFLPISKMTKPIKCYVTAIGP